jgi:hypothetical protein
MTPNAMGQAINQALSQRPTNPADNPVFIHVITAVIMLTMSVAIKND